MKFKAVSTIVALAVMLMQPLAAQAASSGLGAPGRHFPPKFINAGGLTLAPMGHAVFCSKDPASCVLSGASVVRLDGAKRSELLTVNRQVNRAIRPVNDVRLASWSDKWTLAPAAGDCEDFALTKRAELIARGWPSRALRLAVAFTATGEGHAVLVVRTTDGDLVLDNRTSRVLHWHQTDLRWHKIQSAANGRLWQKI